MVEIPKNIKREKSKLGPAWSLTTLDGKPWLPDGANRFADYLEVQEAHIHRSGRVWVCKIVQTERERTRAARASWWAYGTATASDVVFEREGFDLAVMGGTERGGGHWALRKDHGQGQQKVVLWIAQRLGDLAERTPEGMDAATYRKRRDEACQALARAMIAFAHPWPWQRSEWRDAVLDEMAGALSELERGGTRARLTADDLNDCKRLGIYCDLGRAIEGDAEAEKKLQIGTFFTRSQFEQAVERAAWLALPKYPATPPALELTNQCRHKGALGQRDQLVVLWWRGLVFELHRFGNVAQSTITLDGLDGCSLQHSGTLRAHGLWPVDPRIVRNLADKYAFTIQQARQQLAAPLEPRKTSPAQIAQALKVWMEARGIFPDPNPNPKGVLPSSYEDWRSSSVLYNQDGYGKIKAMGREWLPSELPPLTQQQVYEGLRSMGVLWANPQRPEAALADSVREGVMHFLDECECKPTTRAATPMRALHELYTAWQTKVFRLEIKARKTAHTATNAPPLSLDRFAYALELLDVGVSGDRAAVSLGKIPSALARPMSDEAQRRADTLPSFPLPFAPLDTPQSFGSPPRKLDVEPMPGFAWTLDDSPPSPHASLEGLLALSCKREAYLLASKDHKAALPKSSQRESFLGLFEVATYDRAAQAQMVMNGGGPSVYQQMQNGLWMHLGYVSDDKRLHTVEVYYRKALLEMNGRSYEDHEIEKKIRTFANKIGFDLRGHALEALRKIEIANALGDERRWRTL